MNPLLLTLLGRGISKMSGNNNYEGEELANEQSLRNASIKSAREGRVNAQQVAQNEIENIGRTGLPGIDSTNPGMMKQFQIFNDVINRYRQQGK